MNSIEVAAAEAQDLMRGIVPNAVCVPQQWDNRVDCLICLDDGNLVGEMIAIDDLSKERILATAERLRRVAEGAEVRLVNEIRASKRITPESE